jgi:AcrR family transcriptional regulator
MSKSSAPREPSERVLRKRKQVRAEILQAALDIVRAQGLEAVTLDSVAAALQMTKPALYHYFPSKVALMRALVTKLLAEEIDVLTTAVSKAESNKAVVENLLRAFFSHYIHDLDAFRAVYCQSQLNPTEHSGMDEFTVRNEINPRTNHLFDILEARLSGESANPPERARMRRFAFVAWTSALGLLTMLSVADALGDPLIHDEGDLMETLSEVFSNAT